MNNEKCGVQARSANLKAVERTAYHEAGHIVVAAALGLTLGTGGLHVDPLGGGLACICKQSDGTDTFHERLIVAIFAGWLAQVRFCPDSDWQRDTDWQEAHTLLGEMPIKSVEITREGLLGRSKQIVDQCLPAIEALATALLAKDWVPQVRFEGGARRSEETTTTEKHMTCEEAVNLLRQYGIPAVCGPNT